MSNEKGFYNKFKVTRTDGTDCEGGKHEDCDYFVLDLTHDPFAADALEAYAQHCESQRPELSRDLFLKLEQMRQKISCE